MAKQRITSASQFGWHKLSPAELEACGYSRKSERYEPPPGVRVRGLGEDGTASKRAFRQFVLVQTGGPPTLEQLARERARSNRRDVAGEARSLQARMAKSWALKRGLPAKNAAQSQQFRQLWSAWQAVRHRGGEVAAADRAAILIETGLLQPVRLGTQELWRYRRRGLADVLAEQATEAVVEAWR